MGPMWLGWRKPGFEALVAAGLTYADMTALGVEMPVVSLRINYRHALRHGDLVVLESLSDCPVGVRWPWRCQLLLKGSAHG